MTTDDFTMAARKTAWLHHPAPVDVETGEPVDDWGFEEQGRKDFMAGAAWAREYLAAQEVTDAEVLAALNAQGVATYPKLHPAPSLDYWGDKPAEAMRAALRAARAVREEER